MAQVKVQTSVPLAGPGPSPGGPPGPPMASPGPLGLQPSVNGTGPTPPSGCPAPTAGYGDAPVSVSPPGPPPENMANPKEKTPMCLVNELARFNRIQPQYKLLNERGPAHAKIFTVQLSLGEQVWEAEGSSIKKAQHSTASMALEQSILPRPAPRSPKVDINSNPGSITPTVELNGLAMKRGEPAIYRPLDPKPAPNFRANYNFRGMVNQRYHYPIPKVFYVQLSVGSSEFVGEGRTRQAARHNAAMKALQALRNQPLPERPTQSPEEKEEEEEEEEEEGGSDASKSEISLVYEIALKRNLPVSFEVLKESGPPHMKSFLTRVTVGEFSAEGEGNSKKLSKKRAAVSILQDLKKLPFIPAVEKPKLHYKKRPKTILKTGPDYGQGMNPISRLAQIQQAKKEKEPEYLLLSERGLPRRREFILQCVQVKVSGEVATGTGPNKKVAKRNAAEAMLLQLGYKASNLPTELENKGWNGQKAFTEATSNTQKGLLHLSPDVYQEMEASRKQQQVGVAPGVGVANPIGQYQTPNKDMGPLGSAPLPPNHAPSSSSSSSGHAPFYSGGVGGGGSDHHRPGAVSTATIARELLMKTPGQGHASSSLGPAPCSPAVLGHAPSQQLDYLAHIQGFQVQYSDGQNGKEFLTYLTLSPIHMTFHGKGGTLQASHDQAALSALKQLSEQGLDPVDGPIKSTDGAGREDGH